MCREIEKGKKAENRVCGYLVDRGFALVSQNIKIGGVEIDLIMKKSDCYYVFEIKTLQSRDFKDVRVSKSQIKRQKFALELLNAKESCHEVFYFWAFVYHVDIEFLEVHFW